MLAFRRESSIIQISSGIPRPACDRKFPEGPESLGTHTHLAAADGIGFSFGLETIEPRALDAYSRTAT